MQSWIIIVCVVAVILIFLERIVSKKRLNKRSDNIKKAVFNLPYETKPDFFTKNEYIFYNELVTVLEGHAIIFAKVSLKDIFSIPKGTTDYKVFWNKISQKHVDFLLCDINTLNPICGIELDDTSHEIEKVKIRDAFVESVYKKAQLPLIRYKVKKCYTYEEIAEPLSNVISLA